MARAVGIPRKALWGARDRGRVSVALANKIHGVSQGCVRREELRPDIFVRLSAVRTQRPTAHLRRVDFTNTDARFWVASDGVIEVCRGGRRLSFPLDKSSIAPFFLCGLKRMWSLTMPLNEIDIEVTPEMVDAGLACLYDLPELLGPSGDQLAKAVTLAFVAMLKARPIQCSAI